MRDQMLWEAVEKKKKEEKAHRNIENERGRKL
jgi:hypothetical protein